MKSATLRKMITAAVLTALVAAGTAVISIPLPTGYVHLGDGLVLLAGFLLGPIWGAAAAGLGSALADLFLGYALYAPGTFVVKALTAAVCALLCGALSRIVKNPIIPLVGGAVAGALVMVGGYLIYESVILGVGAAAVASVPGNLTQGAVGAVVFCLLAALFRKRRITSNLK